MYQSKDYERARNEPADVEMKRETPDWIVIYTSKKRKDAEQLFAVLNNRPMDTFGKFDIVHLNGESSILHRGIIDQQFHATDAAVCYLQGYTDGVNNCKETLNNASVLLAND